MLRIASEAARVVMSVYTRPFAVDYKAPADPVTEADRLANALICERLAAEFPGVPIVAEESDPSSFGAFQTAPSVFFVDPVDGTREFVERNGEFAVMIGLVESGRAVASVIHAPARNEVFAGWVGDGAFLFDRGEQTPINVSAIDRIRDGRLVGSRSHRNAILERAIQKLEPREFVVMGSAGLKGTLVARGEVEAYVAPGYAGKRWDACATDALVTAAGGMLTDTYGDAIDYQGATLSNDRGLMASNGRVHEALVRELAELRAE